MRRLAGWLAALLTLAAACGASAHALPGTAALLDFHRSSVGLELDMPLDQFELGFKHPVMDAPMRTVERYPEELRAYLLKHVQPVAPDGRPWSVTVEKLWIDPATPISPVDLVARLKLTPPPGAPLRRFRFNYSVINHEVMTHTVLVFARNDWENGVFASKPVLLGMVRWLTTGIDVDRDKGSVWRGLGDVVKLGMLHIADGTDHLLFLLTLLLPAPLLAAGDRWGGYGGARYSLIRLLQIVSAFTIGHSLTLVLGAFGNLQLPTKPVEVAIAFSILVSAVHAWRPVLRGREVWIAAGFGLIHGLSFAQVVAGADMDPLHKTMAVFGFNIGIEFVQLLIVGVTMPWLLILARERAYTPLRVGGAVLAAVAASAWMGERITGHANRVSEALYQLPRLAPFALVALAVVASAVVILRKRRPQPSQLDRRDSATGIVVA